MSRKRGLLVCMVGVDGSGKTTTAHALIQRLNRDGTQIRYLWFKSSLQISISQALHGHLRAEARSPLQSPRKTLANRRSRWTHRMGRTIYRGMVWGEYLIVYGIRVSLYLRHGENCVCDRYVHDLVVDFLAEEHILSENPLERISRVERLFPVPDLVLLFDVPEEVALSRKTDIRSVESLRLRRELYNRLLDSGDVTPIDGTQVPDKNLHEILEAIAELTPSTDVRQVRT